MQTDNTYHTHHTLNIIILNLYFVSLTYSGFYLYTLEKVCVSKNINIVLPSVTARGFNTATPSNCPCSSPTERSHPTTDYPDINVTAGAGIS